MIIRLPVVDATMSVTAVFMSGAAVAFNPKETAKVAVVFGSEVFNCRGIETVLIS